MIVLNPSSACVRGQRHRPQRRPGPAERRGHAANGEPGCCTSLSHFQLRLKSPATKPGGIRPRCDSAAIKPHISFFCMIDVCDRTAAVRVLSFHRRNRSQDTKRQQARANEVAQTRIHHDSIRLPVSGDNPRGSTQKRNIHACSAHFGKNVKTIAPTCEVGL